MSPSSFFFVALTTLIVVLLPLATAQPGRKLGSGLKRDRSALRALANSITDFGRSKVGAWKARGNPCSPTPWPHVTCTDNGKRILSIELANLGIEGSLPAKLKRLARVETINLSNNRFSGSLPSRWAGQKAFRRLTSLNLASNLLSGDLPNRAWNKRGAFRVLEILNLSGNNFTGGLPDGWMSDANSMRTLKLLDLSDNKLGYSQSGDALPAHTPTSSGWCRKGLVDSMGWCPTSVIVRAPALQLLDLSGNGLTGQLPTNWAFMFPSLKDLYLGGNGLYSIGNEPSLLPPAWTGPSSFPVLRTMRIAPGNDYICSVPIPSGGYQSIQQGKEYAVVGPDGAFSKQTPRLCPVTAADKNIPSHVEVVNGTNGVLIQWVAVPADRENEVLGFLVTLLRITGGTGTWQPVAPWNERFVSFQDSEPTPSNTQLAAGLLLHTANTTVQPKADRFKAIVKTMNMDGSLSRKAWSRTQADMLLDFKSTFDNGDQVLSNWRNPFLDPCVTAFSGVECDDIGRVTTIDYCGCSDGLPLEGTIPSEGFPMPLTTDLLILRANNLKGPLPSQWRHDQLAEVNVRLNQLTGSIPKAFIENLPSLERLRMSGNLLSGSLPSVTFPSNTIVVDLDVNMLQGPIHADFRLPNTSSNVYLGMNWFDSVSDEWLASLPTTMDEIGLNDNWLSGPLPKFPPLNGTWIYIEGNDLSGTIPDSQAGGIDLDPVIMFVKPGNNGLCGPTPEGVILADWNRFEEVTLPPCGSVPAVTPQQHKPLRPRSLEERKELVERNKELRQARRRKSPKRLGTSVGN